MKVTDVCLAQLKRRISPLWSSTPFRFVGPDLREVGDLNIAKGGFCNLFRRDVKKTRSSDNCL